MIISIHMSIHVTIFVKLKKVINFLFESYMFYFKLFEYPSGFHKAHMIRNLIQLFKLHKHTRDNICQTKRKSNNFLFESHMFYFQLFEYPSCFHKPHMIKNLIQLFKLHKDTHDNICHIKRTHNYLF